MLDYYGILSLLPIGVLFLFVFTTRRVLLSLFMASLTAAFLIGGGRAVSVWFEYTYQAFGTEFLSWVISLLVVYGMYIHLLERSGWCTEFAQWLAKYATNRKRCLLFTELLGIIIFIDDVLNNMVVGTAMKSLSDNYKIPRTLLAYVTISTSAPVCILLPISSWASCCSSAMMVEGISEKGSFVDIYMKCLPYMYFGYVTLIVVFLVCTGVIPLIGLTKKHQRLAMEEGIVLPEEDAIDGITIYTNDILNTENTENTGKNPNPWKLISSILVIVIVTVVSGDIVIGAAIGGFMTGALMITIEKEKIGDILDCAFEGITTMVPICVQMTIASTLLLLNTEIGMQAYVLEIVTPILSGSMLPALIFVVFTIYSALGGGFIEMIILFMPVVIPAAFAVDANPYMCAAALICASASGSSMYVCGDTIALVSRVTGVKQTSCGAGIFPYAFIASVITTVCFIIAGTL